MEFVAVLLLIAGAIWGPVYMVAQRRRKEDLRLEAQIKILDQVLSTFQVRLEVLERSTVSSKPAAEPEVPPATEEPEQIVEPEAQITADEQPTESDSFGEQGEAEPIPQAALLTPKVESTTRAREEAFTSSWLIWIGGITMALGGGFIVKYSIDQGWIGPFVRVLMGLAVGASMLGVGEYLRRSSAKPLFQRQTPDYLPGTLTGAGIATLYASVWAAFALYSLVSPILAFAALAAIAFLSLALGLLHGPAIASLGILGATVVPAIVSTDSRSTVMLFSYLTVVTAGGMAVVHYRQWWALGGLTLAASFLWVAIWIATSIAAEPIFTVGLFVLAISVIGLWAYRSDVDEDPMNLGTKTSPFIAASTLVSIGALLIFSLANVNHFNVSGMFFVLGYAALLVAAAWYRNEWLLHTSIATALVALSLWFWPRPDDWTLFDLGTAFSLGTEYGRFTLLAIMFSALMGIVGYIGARRPTRSGYWASLSAATPLLVLVITYYRWTDLTTNPFWAAIALALAVALTFCAERHHRSNAALGAFTVGACAALSLALAFYLRDAWLTVALAVQLPAMAFICRRLGLPVLRYVTLVVAGIVILRLGLNSYIFDYELATTPILNWLLWGYGLPAIAFWWSARQFLAEKDGPLVKVLEAGAIAFATLFVTLQVRSLFQASLDAPYTDFTEASIQTLSLMGIGYGLYRRNLLQHRMVMHRASQLLRYGGLAHLFIIQGVVLNPLFTHVDVGSWPVLNMVLLAYLGPAILTALYARAAMRRGDQLEVTIMGAMTLALVFVFVSLCVRQFFVGPYLDQAPVSDAEQYTYSIVWILYGIALLSLGIWRNIRALRYASLGVLMLATAKVFLWDMNGLTGLLRAVSFLGLGGTLLTIGFVYQRFVFPAAPIADAAENNVS